MRAPSELQMLGELRASGKAPTLPVWITNNRVLAANIARCGALAIVVVSDHWECDWSALAGLDVILATSFYATPVGTRLCVAIRECRPRRLRAWIDGEGFSTMALARCAPMEREEDAA